jgi:hypothetical protein
MSFGQPPTCQYGERRTTTPNITLAVAGDAPERHVGRRVNLLGSKGTA